MLTVGPPLVSAAVHSRRRLVPVPVPVLLSALLCASALPDRLVRSTKRRFPHAPRHLSDLVVGSHEQGQRRPEPILHTFPEPTRLASPRLDSTRVESKCTAPLLSLLHNFPVLVNLICPHCPAVCISPSPPPSLVAPSFALRQARFPLPCRPGQCQPYLVPTWYLPR